MFPWDNDDEKLSEDQLREYNRTICNDFWNPGAIDSNPNLTESQKQQLKDYNRVWGDGGEGPGM